MVLGTLIEALGGQQVLIILTGFAASFLYVLHLRKNYNLRGNLDGLGDLGLGVFSVVYFLLFLYISLFSTFGFWAYTDLFGGDIFQAWVVGEILIIALFGTTLEKPAYRYIAKVWDITEFDGILRHPYSLELFFSTLTGFLFTVYAHLFLAVSDISSLFGPQPLRFWVVSTVMFWVALRLWELKYVLSNYFFTVGGENRKSFKQRFIEIIGLE